MLNFYIRKVTLKNGDTRYRTIITRSGKAIKTKTFRRKSDARTYGNRLVIEYQGHEAKGVKSCTVTFSKLADEYMKDWSGKDHDRVRLVLWWENQFGVILLSEITPERIREKLKLRLSGLKIPVAFFPWPKRQELSIKPNRKAFGDLADRLISQNTASDNTKGDQERF